MFDRLLGSKPNAARPQYVYGFTRDEVWEVYFDAWQREQTTLVELDGYPDVGYCVLVWHAGRKRPTVIRNRTEWHAYDQLVAQRERQQRASYQAPHTARQPFPSYPSQPSYPSFPSFPAMPPHPAEVPAMPLDAPTALLPVPPASVAVSAPVPVAAPTTSGTRKRPATTPRKPTKVTND